MIRKFIRSTFLAVAASIVLAFAATSARAETWRQAETGASTIRGAWTWDAAKKNYAARWENGASAVIYVDSIDDKRVVMTRVDNGGSGFTARYVGTRQGRTLSGTVSWSYQGRTWSGTWRAEMEAAPPSSSNVLTLQQAQSLFNTMARQADISFEYPWDGCYARAHLMARRLQGMGVQPGKVWSFANGEQLHVRSNRDARGFIEWGYHVAPTVPVQSADGRTVPMVIDPSMFNRPVGVNEWLNAQRKSTVSPWPKYCLTRMGEAPVLANGARAAGTGYWITADPPGDLDTHAAGEMRRFRQSLRRAG